MISRWGLFSQIQGIDKRESRKPLFFRYLLLPKHEVFFPYILEVKNRVY